jgi:hypothetical protein
MARLLRLGGRAELPTGERLIWSIADGRRGRRWRSARRTRDGTLRSALLLETDADDRLSRLELTSTAGLLTLHPGPDGGSLHGNVVEEGGIDHIAVGWSPEHAVLSFDEPILVAACLRMVADEGATGGSRRLPVQFVDAASMDVQPGEVVVERLGDGAWRLVDPASELTGRRPVERTVRLDDDGLVELPGATSWPLEL